MSPVTDSRIKEQIRISTYAEVISNLATPNSDEYLEYNCISISCSNAVDQRQKNENGGKSKLDELNEREEQLKQKFESLAKNDGSKAHMISVIVCMVAGVIIGYSLGGYNGTITAIIGGVIGFLAGMYGVGIIVSGIVKSGTNAAAKMTLENDYANNIYAQNAEIQKTNRQIWYSTDQQEDAFLSKLFADADAKIKKQIAQYDRNAEDAFKRYINSPDCKELSKQIVGTAGQGLVHGSNTINFEIKRNKLLYNKGSIENGALTYVFEEHNMKSPADQSECEGYAGAVAKTVSADIKAKYKSNTVKVRTSHNDANVTLEIILG